MKLKKDTPLERIINGIYTENPVFCLILGMCPTLATTTSAINGLGMGLATTFVLLGSNVVISALRKVIPDTVRIPAFIVIWLPRSNTAITISEVLPSRNTAIPALKMYLRNIEVS